MKIIGRTIAILAAALVVVGITFAVAQSSAAQDQAPAGPGWAVQGQSAAAAGAGAPDQGAPPDQFEREGAHGPSLFGALEVLKNLIVVGVIVALGALAAWVRRRRWPGGGARRSHAAPSATRAGCRANG